MPRFTGIDFYDIDSLLSDEERQIRDHVRDWVEDRYLGLVEKAYEEAYFPAEVIPEVAEMGLLGATLPWGPVRGVAQIPGKLSSTTGVREYGPDVPGDCLGHGGSHTVRARRRR